MRHDLLADALSTLKNVRNSGQKEIVIRPVSKIVIKVLDLIQREGYIESFEIIKDGRGDAAKVKLNNLINNIGVIKPRYSAKLEDFEKFEKRYLPAKDFGRLIVSTSKGIMTHIEAKKNNQGGVLLAYVY